MFPVCLDPHLEGFLKIAWGYTKPCDLGLLPSCLVDSLEQFTRQETRSSWVGEGQDKGKVHDPKREVPLSRQSGNTVTFAKFYSSGENFGS